MKAGDLLIFNSTEPHGIRPNKSKNKVRIAQYISMMPAEEENEGIETMAYQFVEESCGSLKDMPFPVIRRNWEQEKYETAKLSPLGEKLLGLKKW